MGLPYTLICYVLSLYCRVGLPSVWSHKMILTRWSCPSSGSVWGSNPLHCTAIILSCTLLYWLQCTVLLHYILYMLHCTVLAWLYCTGCSVLSVLSVMAALHHLMRRRKNMCIKNLLLSIIAVDGISRKTGVYAALYSTGSTIRCLLNCTELIVLWCTGCILLYWL